MTDNNIFTFFYDLFYRLLEYGRYAWEFLFQTHYVGFRGLKVAGVYLIDFGFDVSVLGLLLGGGFVVFIILWLVKEFVPLA